MNKTTETLHNRNTPFTWIILLAALFFFLPSMLMSYFWVHLESVHISNPVKDDGVIELTVDRQVHRRFKGNYAVTILKINGSNKVEVCQGMPLAPVTYDPFVDLPEPVSLTWWLGSEAHMDICRQNGFEVGNEFQIRTCHTVLVTEWNIPFARRCVYSNVFELT